MNTKTLKGNCESCLMPFAKDPKGENRENEKYCSYCFNNGGLCYSGNDLKEFKKAMVEEIVKRGESRFKANIYAFMAGFAPRWKGQNNLLAKIFSKHANDCVEKDK